ncbi:hypothetical protein [Aquimarina aggregata]|uniref:hypothetical protein n=1 Tax=Aquimarina aggregata TaxID=1642818 RepID=UPI0024917B00|nr:hypothetical protein [Aquimarina aggregata]
MNLILFQISLGQNVHVDIYFNHFNYDIFSKLINDNIEDYSYYLVILANLQETKLVIERLTKGKAYILDQTNKDKSPFHLTLDWHPYFISKNLINKIPFSYLKMYHYTMHILLKQMKLNYLPQNIIYKLLLHQKKSIITHPNQSNVIAIKPMIGASNNFKNKIGF